MTKKYELTKEKKETILGTLFRIKALVDFRFCKKGELGGFIASEKNLSQTGNAWVSGNALVYGNAWVSGNALVYGDARVYGNAWVSGNARVYGDALVYGNAWVSGNALVYGNIKIKEILCSRFDFEFQWQFELWQKMEKKFEEEVKKKRIHATKTKRKVKT